MTKAKPISLAVRAARSAHLCFETDGILGALPAQLGAPVSAFDFDGFAKLLGDRPTVAGEPWRLEYDDAAIWTKVQPNALAALRAEPQKIALRKAIWARANAWFSKYGKIPQIVAQTEAFYNPASSTSKWSRLGKLAWLAQWQADQLSAAYIADKRTGVVKSTVSALASQTVSGGFSSQIGQSNEQSLAAVVDGHSSMDHLPPGGGSLAPDSYNADYPVNDTFSDGSSSSTSSSQGFATEKQTIVNTDYGYRVPNLENQAQLERAHISLMDEQFGNFMQTLNLDSLQLSLTYEAAAVDADVNRVQLAYLATILFSPIEGTVTGVYKQPGEAVRAGETVMRVEDPSTLLLVAGLVCESVVTIGATLTVTTRLYGSNAPPISVAGPVVSARGRPESDNHWEVIASLANLDAGGNPILPLGYHFNREDTTIVLS